MKGQAHQLRCYDLDIGDDGKNAVGHGEQPDQAEKGQRRLEPLDSPVGQDEQCCGQTVDDKEEIP